MNNETIIKNETITNIRISDGAYRCYILLQAMAYGNKCTCFPSEKFLGISLGRSVRSIQRYLKELVRNNLIHIKRRGSTSNVYTILAKKTKQVGEKVVNAVNAVKKAYNDCKANKTTYKQEKPSTFNFKNQRDYNFSSLKNMLLGRKEYNKEELYNNQT